MGGGISRCCENDAGQTQQTQGLNVNRGRNDNSVPSDQTGTVHGRQIAQAKPDTLPEAPNLDESPKDRSEDFAALRIDPLNAQPLPEAAIHRDDTTPVEREDPLGVKTKSTAFPHHGPLCDSGPTKTGKQERPLDDAASSTDVNRNDLSDPDPGYALVKALATGDYRKLNDLIENLGKYGDFLIEQVSNALATHRPGEPFPQETLLLVRRVIGYAKDASAALGKLMRSEGSAAYRGQTTRLDYFICKCEVCAVAVLKAIGGVYDVKEEAARFGAIRRSQELAKLLGIPLAKWMSATEHMDESALFLHTMKLLNHDFIEIAQNFPPFHATLPTDLAPFNDNIFLSIYRSLVPQDNSPVPLEVADQLEAVFGRLRDQVRAICNDTNDNTASIRDDVRVLEDIDRHVTKALSNVNVNEKPF